MKKGSRGFPSESGAGNEARTRDLNLGKVALYQLSYSRISLADALEFLPALLLRRAWCRDQRRPELYIDFRCFGKPR